MITDFIRRKAGENATKRPTKELPAKHEVAIRPFGALSAGSDLSGMELADFAAQAGMTEAEVWERIRLGELVSRNVNGRLLVYGDSAPDEPGIESLTAEEPRPPAPYGPGIEPPGGGLSLDSHPELPPLPVAKEEPPMRALVPDRMEHGLTDVALLLDHLSLAKEENKEILRMTQDSMERITSMSESLMAMKDAVIRDKEQKISGLEAEMVQRDRTIAKLRQELEDLEMLTRSLTGK